MQDKSNRCTLLKNIKFIYTCYKAVRLQTCLLLKVVQINLREDKGVDHSSVKERSKKNYHTLQLNIKKYAKQLKIKARLKVTRSRNNLIFCENCNWYVPENAPSPQQCTFQHHYIYNVHCPKISNLFVRPLLN